MSRAPAKAPTQMVYLTIGYSHFLMEPAKAMKVAELMQHAVNVDWEWDRSDRNGDTYVVGDAVNVEFRLIPTSKVRMPNGEAVPTPAKPRLLR